MIVPAVLVFRDMRNGTMLPGSAKVAEWGNAGAAIAWLERDGWSVGSKPTIFTKRNGYVLHECRLIY